MELNKILNQVTQQLQEFDNSSPTPVGDSVTLSVEQKSAINQIFALFRFNYSNQFLKAFPDLDTLIMAKQLWGRLLANYSPDSIMQAAEQTVKESSYLPSVHEVIRRCGSAQTSSAYSAYIEACRAPSPKKAYPWSHAIVYYAGVASDWFFLANNSEDVAFPVFARNYEILQKRLQAGEKIELEIPRALPEKIEILLPKAESQKRLQEIIQSLQ